MKKLFFTLVLTLFAAACWGQVIPIVVTKAGALPATGRTGQWALATDTGAVYIWNGGAWNIISGGGGDVTGPAGATNLALAIFNGATGKVLQDSGVTIPMIRGSTNQSTAGTNDTFQGNVAMQGLTADNGVFTNNASVLGTLSTPTVSSGDLVVTNPITALKVIALTAQSGVFTNSLQVGSTNVEGALSAKAPLAGPVFTGDPQVPNVVLSDSDTTVANTAFVKSNITAAASGYQVGNANLTNLATGVLASGVLTKTNTECQIGVWLDGGGSAITAGTKGWTRLPYAMQVNGWEITAQPSGTIVIDIWTNVYPNIPVVGGTITGTEKPSLSGASAATDTSITTWAHTNLAAGTYIMWDVEAGVATVTNVNVSVFGIRK